jgi:YegS/Rv2252/BmrU family lipid kinase
MPRKLLFIINPKAGKKLGPALLPLIEKKLKGKLEHEIAIWKNIAEFHLIEERLHMENFTDAIAVGGDGTVNMVAKTVLNTNFTLGIIPAGSGNGLARSLGLPMDTEEALDTVIEGKSSVIDSGEANGIPFFCTSGVGFDAHISHLFATSETRGLKSYVKIIRREFSNYKPQTYVLKYNGEAIERTAFLITVANAGQYGNDFYIAPTALMNDSLFQVVILKPFKSYNLPGLLLKIFRRKAYASRFIETFSCSELLIERRKEDFLHFDGEPAMAEKNVIFKCRPHSLRAIIGPGFKAA